METFETQSPEQTRELGRRLAKRLARGDCLALVGELGAGKTILVRGVAEGFGADPQLVSSPTYVLVQQYPGEMMDVFHLDLYRLTEAESELLDLGVDEMLAEGIVAIEWADRGGDALPRPRWELSIEHRDEHSRRFRLRRVE
jgi:tRNA threonylcarbamoyladenosine biosynthesis protein TsaE